MTREIINNVSYWWLIILCMLFFLILSYLSARISVYFFSKPVDKDYWYLTNSLIGILSTGFSILLAFTIINTWNYQLVALNASSREAAFLALMVRNSAVFPPEAKEKIIKATLNYAVAVRIDEWKMMRKGKDSQKAWDAIEQLNTAIQNYIPQTAKEKFYYSQVVSHMDNLLQARRDRLTEIVSVIPHALRTALVIGSILLTIILGGIRSESDLYHLMPVLLFSPMLGFNLALAINFDYPYSGDIAVSNKLYYSGVLGQFSD
jgi:hypothetical protein